MDPEAFDYVWAMSDDDYGLVCNSDFLLHFSSAHTADIMRPRSNSEVGAELERSREQRVRSGEELMGGGQSGVEALPGAITVYHWTVQARVEVMWGRSGAEREAGLSAGTGRNGMR